MGRRLPLEMPWRWRTPTSATSAPCTRPSLTPWLRGEPARQRERPALPSHCQDPVRRIWLRWAPTTWSDKSKSFSRERITRQHRDHSRSLKRVPTQTGRLLALRAGVQRGLWLKRPPHASGGSHFRTTLPEMMHRGASWGRTRPAVLGDASTTRRGGDRAARRAPSGRMGAKLHRRLTGIEIEHHY